MDHQRRGAEIALAEDRFGFFDDTGSGKTIEAIEIIKQKQVKTLVVCNLALISNAWAKDLNQFAPDLRVVNLWEALRKRSHVPEHDVALINYERFRSAHEKLTGYEMVIIDESSKIKSHKSQITKALIRYTDKVQYVYLLSGTPAPNNEMEYWSQFRIIDRSLLGNSYYSFRNKYCFPYGYGGYQWKLRDEMRPKFLEKISTKSRVVRKEDVLDLPERTFNIRTCHLDCQEMSAYRTMEREMLLEIGDRESLAATAATKLLKLRQGTSGFYYDSEGKPIIVGTTKLGVLQDLLAEIGNKQVVIWFQFRAEGDQIMSELTGAGRVDGSISRQQDKDQTVRDFIAGGIQYLVAHPASIGHGVTLTNCSYAVYFSMSHSYEQHYQSQDRIYRYGQKNACTYYHLVADKTVDGEILKALERKEDTAMAVFKYLKMERGE